MQNNNNYGGISFVGLLQITFIVLKLIDKIDWSWWWVLSPMWISSIIFILVFIMIILSLIVKALGK